MKSTIHVNMSLFSSIFYSPTNNNLPSWACKSLLTWDCMFNSSFCISLNLVSNSIEYVNSWTELLKTIHLWKQQVLSGFYSDSLNVWTFYGKVFQFGIKSTCPTPSISHNEDIKIAFLKMIIELHEIYLLLMPIKKLPNGNILYMHYVKK